MLGLYPTSHVPVVLAIPMDTKKNVPKNSANNIFQILRLFVMSVTPMIRLTPAKTNEKPEVLEEGKNQNSLSNNNSKVLDRHFNNIIIKMNSTKK